jgi:hypothetical protein
MLLFNDFAKKIIKFNYADNLIIPSFRQWNSFHKNDFGRKIDIRKH